MNKPNTEHLVRIYYEHGDMTELKRLTHCSQHQLDGIATKLKLKRGEYIPGYIGIDHSKPIASPTRPNLMWNAPRSYANFYKD